MRLIGIGPTLHDPPTDLAGWKLSRDLIAGLRSEAGFDLGAFGRLKFAFVTALVEPSTDYADAAPPEPRDCPFGELSIEGPVFWDDNGVFTMAGSDDPIVPGQVGAYSYGFRCSQMLKIALGAPDFDPPFPGHATDADVEPYLTPPPHTPDECLAWVQARLPAGSARRDLDAWLSLSGASEWNGVMRYTALALQKTHVPGVGFVQSSASGRLVSTGLPEGPLTSSVPGFSFGGAVWRYDGNHYRAERGDLPLSPADFLRATVAVAALAWDFTRKNVRLSGAQAAAITEVWTVDRLPWETFLGGLPF